jgi:signal recognition particle subunit SEC65
MTTPAPHATGHAFISYVHEDSESVDAICEVLEAAGISVWRDKDQLWPGDEWKIQMRRAIQNNSLAFIACFSEASNAKESTYQNEELILAVEEYRKRKPGRPWLFPVRFGNVELPKYDLGANKTLDALQSRWEQSLRQRAQVADGSAVPLLGRLLAGVLAAETGTRARLAPRNGHQRRRNAAGRSRDTV